MYMENLYLNETDQDIYSYAWRTFHRDLEKESNYAKNGTSDLFSPNPPATDFHPFFRSLGLLP